MDQVVFVKIQTDSVSPAPTDTACWTLLTNLPEHHQPCLFSQWSMVDVGWSSPAADREQGQVIVKLSARENERFVEKQRG